MTTIAIQYGIFGGPQRGKRFLGQLRLAGYQIIYDSKEADIILAHSAGCFWLPPSNNTQKIMLIDPPYWPGMKIKARSRARTKSNLQFREHAYSLPYWLPHNLWGIYYGFTQLPRHIRIARFASKYSLPDTLKGRRILLVRTQHDDWLTPDFEQLKKQHPKLQTVTMPGDHDNCWHNPKPYIELLKRLQ